MFTYICAHAHADRQVHCYKHQSIHIYLQAETNWFKQESWVIYISLHKHPILHVWICMSSKIIMVRRKNDFIHGYVSTWLVWKHEIMRCIKKAGCYVFTFHLFNKFIVQSMKTQSVGFHNKRTCEVNMYYTRYGWYHNMYPNKDTYLYTGIQPNAYWNYKIKDNSQYKVNMHINKSTGTKYVDVRL